MIEKLDKKSFKELFDKHYTEIMHFVYYKSANEKLAEDITQDAFFALWEKRQNINLKTAKSYLYKTANNMFISSTRKAKVEFGFRSTIETSALSESPEFEMEFKEFNKSYQNALMRLSDKQRCVFLMNRVDGLTYKKIAERLEISVKAVEKRMKLAILSLEEYLNVKV